MQAEQRLTHRPTQPGSAALAEEGLTKRNTTPVPATGDIAIAIEEENPPQVDEVGDYLDVFISAVVGSLLIAGVLFL
jgi:hypothetical protein